MNSTVARSGYRAKECLVTVPPMSAEFADVDGVLDPDQAIVDPHHHLWDRPTSTYLVDEILADIGTGHQIEATVFVECKTRYRETGRAELRPIGEAEFVAAAAEEGTRKTGGLVNLCAAMSGGADLRHGRAAVDELLGGLNEASQGRLRGIRHIAAYDPHNNFVRSRPPPNLLSDRDFREGFACLSRHGLLFEAMVYHPQLPELTDLARAFPETTIVLNHVGVPLGAGTFANRRAEVSRIWKADMQILASCPNVIVKVGGFGMPMFGFGFEAATEKPTASQLAGAIAPYVETCAETFGAARCMFESNFPVDKVSFGYRTAWNAFKIVTRNASASEKNRLFRETAIQTYRLA